ncbi:hypothetical protein NC651_033682 [Populus alba x Populus x berolinensis]|nr:hypothetical protein NC651_033682 [Populus alba x Populus x berolinensis]
MSSHNNNSTSANDPRQPSAAKPFVAPMVSPQDLPVDYSGFIAVILGVAGVMFRYKLCSWLALIFCAQSLSNMRNMENDLKQISMASIKGRKQGFSCMSVEELDTCNGTAVYVSCLQSWDWLQITWVQLDLAHKVEREILSIRD